MSIVNEAFQDATQAVADRLKDQLKCEVKGCVMFFLIKRKDGKDQWVSVHNYKGIITDVNMLYFYECVQNHVKKDFLDVAEGT